MGKLKYIVTGTGRCGTVYFAKFLTSLGINCGHETIFSYHGLERALERLEQPDPLKVSLISELSTWQDEIWFPNGIVNIQADSSYMAAPFLSHPAFDGAKVIHVFRHPLEVINSFIYGLGYFKRDCVKNEDMKDYHKFIYKHAPMILNYANPIDRAAVYYVEWNKLIEKNSLGKDYYRHNISRNLGRVFDFLNMKEPNSYYDNKKSNNILGLNPIITSFKDIPSQQARESLIEFYNRYFYIKLLGTNNESYC